MFVNNGCSVINLQKMLDLVFRLRGLCEIANKRVNYSQPSLLICDDTLNKPFMA